MSPFLPVRVYGLEVVPGVGPIPAHVDGINSTLRITMAAIDPSAEPQLDASTSSIPRATLRILRVRDDEEEEEDDESDDDDIDAIERRLGDIISDVDEDSDEEEANGGPSDPAKSKKAKKDAAAKKLIEALKEGGMDVDTPNGVNGTKSKGKGKASDEDDDSDLEEEDAESEVEEFVICTLDPEKHYQQPIDITINENEEVYFQVIGTHSIYLTGNYVLDPSEMMGHSHDHSDDEEEDLDYMMGPDEDEYDEDEESDELDDLEDPRITEIDTDDEEEAPKLIKATDKKGKNKRAAEDAVNGLDELISKSAKTKKQKNNDGKPVAATAEKSAEKSPSNKSDKKVQFAKNLELGPTGSPANKKDAKKDDKKEIKKDDKQKPTLGPKTLAAGVKIDDKKLGSGPAAKNGDKIGMRYIGKLEKDGKVFDSNKKGKPFTFTLGKGQVIKGWDVGIAGMQVGGERRIVIPASAGYGSKGVPGIPSNSTLVFDVKMLSLN